MYQSIRAIGSLTPVLCPQLDAASSAYISAQQFWTLLRKHGTELDPHKLDVLLALANSNSNGTILYQDVVNLVSGWRRVKWAEP